MKNNIKHKEESRFFSGFAIFLFSSIYPFIGFFEHNVSETYYWVSIFIAWCASVFVGAFAIWITVKIFPKWSILTSGIIWGFSLIILFSFHHIEKITADVGINLGTIKILIWLTLVFCVATLGFFISKSKNLSKITLYVLIGFLLAPMVNVSTSLYDSIYNQEKESIPLGEKSSSQGDLQERPNVYWLIPDMYARHDILKEEYNFDNRDFLEKLSQKGYFVADKAYSNLNSTKLSISTTLSMDYFLPVQTEINPASWQSILQGDNQVVQTFRSWGYNYVHVEPGGNTLKTRCGGGEDFCVHGAQIGLFSLNEAHIGLMKLTPFYRILKNLQLDIFSFDFTRIEDLKKDLNAKKFSPFFMFAHVLSPHPPARFDERCEYLENTDWELLGHGDSKVDQNYVQDIKCLNERIINYLDWINESDPNAIVILQADHGSFLHTNRMESTPNNIVKKEYWRPSLAILSAYKAPQRCLENLYASISPINNFPFVFSCLENTKFSPSPDRSFIQHRKDEYEKFHEEIYEIHYSTE
ncbi:sulfatase-like hydrolase/transferase [Thalassospira tepidiphila]|uniref:sulfatase-like hydrolase/transferase n=1 Tax=Thalassospira tepidiphila TaxID=393657 RepID=UPI003AA9B0CA